MGVPGFTKAAIPMRGPAWETFLGQPFDVGGGITLTASAVSMGNPHLVLFVEDDPGSLSTSSTSARRSSTTSRSPRARTWSSRRCDRTAIKARVWERGLGRDHGVRQRGVRRGRGGERGRAGRRPTTVVRFPGGALEVERLESGEVLLTGEAERVFEGVVDLDRLRGRVRA